MSHRRLTAVFDDERKILAATRAARETGFVVVDVYTPFPVHGMDEAMGIRPSRLTWVCFLFGALGAGLALYFQFWTSAVDWPINVGGKPFDSLPAFIPIVFEITVLFASLGVVVALFLRCRLGPGRQAYDPVPGVCDDRFALQIELRGAVPSTEDFELLAAEHGALEVVDALAEDPSCAV